MMTSGQKSKLNYAIHRATFEVANGTKQRDPPRALLRPRPNPGVGMLRHFYIVGCYWRAAENGRFCISYGLAVAGTWPAASVTVRIMITVSCRIGCLVSLKAPWERLGKNFP